MKKDNGVLKWVLIIIAIALLLAILAILMPLALIGGLIATWYYIKKKPNPKKRNIAITVATVGLLGSIFITPNLINQSNQSETTQNLTTTSSSSKAKQDKKLSSASTESSKTETSESKTKPSTKNDGPEYTEKSNEEFANAFQDMLNTALSESGVSTTVQVTHYDRNLIYVYVPQDYKYETNVNIQKLADTIYQAKESKFTEWAIDKGYDLGYTHAPTLYLKSEDDTVLAEESGILNKKMKLKVDNS